MQSLSSFRRFPCSMLAGLTLAAGLLVTPQAQALQTTSTGQYSICLAPGSWASGSATCYSQVSGTLIAVPSLSSSIDNQMMSFSLCNNTGSTSDYYVILFENASYDTQLENYHLTVASGGCSTVELPTSDQDKVSSFKVHLK